MKDVLSLSELLAGLSRRNMPLASESALFLALQAVEHRRENPASLDLESVLLHSDGSVTLRAAKATPEPEALRSVGALLVRLVDPLSPEGERVVARLEAGTTKWTSVASELEALLVPLNRSASRRVLGRLLREVQKSAPASDATASSTADPAPSAQETVLEGATASIPPLPPPPRLGSLAQLTPRSPEEPSQSAIDTAPEGKSASGSSAPGEASDTVPEGSTLAPGAPQGASRWLPMLALVALVAALLFVWFRARGH